MKKIFEKWFGDYTEWKLEQEYVPFSYEIYLNEYTVTRGIDFMHIYSRINKKTKKVEFKTIKIL
jgi:hypothetical protein